MRVRRGLSDSRLSSGSTRSGYQAGLDRRYGLDPAPTIKRYLCAGRQPGHQRAILALSTDELVAERALAGLTPVVREALLGSPGPMGDGPQLRRALADLVRAQSRLYVLDDDYSIGCTAHWNTAATRR